MNGNARWIEKCAIGVAALALHLPLLLWRLDVRPVALPPHAAAIGIVLLAATTAEKLRYEATATRSASPTRTGTQARRGAPVAQRAPSADRAGTALPASSAPASQPGAPPSAQRRPLDLTYRTRDEGARRRTQRERLQDTDSDGRSPLERALARAQRLDCRTAYATLGLFALPRLLFEADGEGCKW